MHNKKSNKHSGNQQSGVVLMTVLLVLSLLGLCVIFAAKLLNHQQHMTMNQQFTYEDDIRQMGYLRQISQEILQDLDAGIATDYSPQILGPAENCDLGLWDADFLENSLQWQAIENANELAFLQMDPACNTVSVPSIEHFWVLTRIDTQDSNIIFAQSLYQGFDITGSAMHFTQQPMLVLP